MVRWAEIQGIYHSLIKAKISLWKYWTMDIGDRFSRQSVWSAVFKVGWLSIFQYGPGMAGLVSGSSFLQNSGPVSFISPGGHGPGVSPLITHSLANSHQNSKSHASYSVNISNYFYQMAWSPRQRWGQVPPPFTPPPPPSRWLALGAQCLGLTEATSSSITFRRWEGGGFRAPYFYYLA